MFEFRSLTSPTILLLCLLVALWFLWWAKYRLFNPVFRLPSPKTHWPFGLFLGHTLQLDGKNSPKQFAQWAKECGPVYRLHLGPIQVVVVNNFDNIYKVLVTKGKEVSGRSRTWRGNMIFKRTGILFSTEADKTWKGLRKASHQHLKQFGDGMGHLENVINEVSEDMFKAFGNAIGQPYDPYQSVFDTALGTIAFLITGDRMHSGHPIVEKMREVERDVPYYTTSPRMRYMIYQLVPALKYLRLEGWRELESVMKVEDELWINVLKHNKENLQLESFVSTMLAHLQNGPDSLFSEKDVQKTVSSLLFAGVTTTSATFYTALNVLAHYQDIQESLNKEVQSVVGGTKVSLQHRKRMPHTQAFLLEILRNVSLVSLGVFHRTTEETEIGGYVLPNNTVVCTNLWALHHDESFWDDPFEYKPERFLDEDGKLVLADHPNRRHLMPFGAGTRVCLGESLALARLFLWIATLVQNYKIYPAECNIKSNVDPRNFEFEGVLRIPRYKVLLQSR